MLKAKQLVSSKAETPCQIHMPTKITKLFLYHTYTKGGPMDLLEWYLTFVE